MDELKLNELLFKASIVSGYDCDEAVENIKKVWEQYDQRFIFEFFPSVVRMIAAEYNKNYAQLRRESLSKEFVFDFVFNNEDKINEDFIKLGSIVTRFDFNLLKEKDIDILKNATNIAFNFIK